MNFPSLLQALPQHETLRRLVLMRCIALALQLLAVLVVSLGLGIVLPLWQLITVIGLLAVFNCWAWIRMQRPSAAEGAELTAHLLADVVALSALLYFSGGATNPFVSFYLPIIAVASAILPWRFALALTLISIAAYSTLGFVYRPLRLQDVDQAVTYHLAGMWATFAMSAGLIAWFVARMSGALRQRDAQLAHARERHLQSDGIVALGAQAASAAHEMGTPLSTVAIIAGELRAESQRLPALSQYRDDLAVMESQIALCKLALDRMKLQVRSDEAAGSTPTDLRAWLVDFIEGWRLRYPATRLSQSIPDIAQRIDDTSVVSQILLTLLDNAAQASRDAQAPLALSLSTDAESATIRIEDGGKGIAPDLQRRIGYEPVRSTSGGQGIGLMLAFASARQIGARIEFAARKPNGTIATLTVRLA